MRVKATYTESHKTCATFDSWGEAEAACNLAEKLGHGMHEVKWLDRDSGYIVTSNRVYLKHFEARA